MPDEPPESDLTGDHGGYRAVRAVAAGAVGLLLQFGVLSVAQSIGLFGPDVLGRLASPVGGGTVAGATVFVAAGLVVWPAVFAPFARRLDRGPLVGGLAFGLLLWPVFTVLFAPTGASGADLALYALFGLVAHALYGFGIGVVVALLGPDPDTARRALGQLFAAPSSPASPSGTEPTGMTDDGASDPGARAAAATAGADAASTTADTSTETTTGADTASTTADTSTERTTSAPPGTAGTSGTGGTAAPQGTTEPAAEATTEAANTNTADGSAADTAPSEPEPAGEVEDATEAAPVPGDGIVRPEDLPPLLDFEQALDRIRPHVESGAAADQFELIEHEYERLKRRGAEGRHPIVSDIANHLSGLRERLPRDSPARRWVDSMDNRVSMYLRSGYRPSDTLHLVGVELLGPDGEPTDVTELREQAARIRATVVNGGERSGAVAIVTFRHENGVLLRSVDLSMGYVGAGERKTLDTTVYVPSIASSFEVRAAAPEDGRQFLPEL